MSGFPLYNSNAVASILHAPAPDGEPVFVLSYDESSDGKEQYGVAVTTLDWLREQYYAAVQDDSHPGPDFEDAAVLLPGSHLLTPVDITLRSGRNPGDGPVIVLRPQLGGDVIATYPL